MNLIKEISNNTISISDFNRGLAGRIFDEVKEAGVKVVLKNNKPECVLVSPDDYSQLIEELEKAQDLLLAEERMASLKDEDLVSQEEYENIFGVNLGKVDPIDESEFE